VVVPAAFLAPTELGIAVWFVVVTSAQQLWWASMSVAAHMMLGMGSAEFTRLRLGLYLRARRWVCLRSESAALLWPYPPSLHQISPSYGIGSTAATVYDVRVDERVECIWVALQTDCPATASQWLVLVVPGLS
jgi:hypothetical protein